MSTLLAPLAPIANTMLNGRTTHTALPNQTDTEEVAEIATAAATSTPLNTAIPVPNREELGAPLSKNRAQEASPNNLTTVLNVRILNSPARATGFRDMPVQTVSTRTDNNSELQRTRLFATTAGLYGTFPGKESPARLPLLEKTKHNAAAAHYLRTAETRDLPSYPTTGLSHPEAAGAAAAFLAHRTHNPVEIWRPDPISAAGAAASLAHASSKCVGVWEPTPSKPTREAALRALGEPPFPRLYLMPESYKRWSLTGAIGAIQSSKGKRWRSGSSPMPLTIRQEAEAASAGNSALTAATIAHMPPARRLSVAADPTSEGVAESKMLDAVRVPQQDKRRSDILRAATVSMSKSNRSTTLPADIPRQNNPVQPDLQRSTTTPPSRRYNSNTQETVRKVAVERLERIGYDTDRPPPASLLENQGAQTLVNNSYSVTNAGSSDIGRARKIDAEMALLQDNLTQVGVRKRGEDAALLMSAAQRNVQARMSGIDKQIAESRGVVRREDWDAKAIQVAQASSDKRMKHQGKVSIGGGAYMAPEEIGAIAERSVQPVLDDINRRADAERARGLEVQLDIEELRRVQDLQRIREREKREDIKRAKVVEKEDEKRRKEDEKRAMKERKQLAKIDSKRGVGDAEALRSPVSPTSPLPDGSNREGGIRGLINRFRRRHSRQISRDEKNTIATSVPDEGSTVVPTFSGGHRAALSEQRRENEANDSRVVANASPRPVPASRIPRPVSMVVVPQTNGLMGASTAVASPGTIRSASVAGVPPVVTNGTEKTPVKRRHSLSSIGATGYHFKGRKYADGAARSPSWAEDQGIKKGKGKILGRKTRDFAKINGRISSTEDHSEYPDEARDTFSQQSTSFVPLNRPSSGFFPNDKRRFSAGETSISSRFREDL